ncbi:PH domain-containing protein [Actinomycetospora termitidis]|uniref:PH domain-containing protein n=1 Tax=Actinomycetospora termitidis TaxID=3053470 RepID=A0ABT7M6K8_9PSEU|nr:PH domain-containing protein [Actinomycetospora sp. Odt1-22]MDL5155879.1 PH domain-containing protein [Actinomycetospora sp. Odt1-22]
MADDQQTSTAEATTPAAPATFRAVPTVALVAAGFLALCLSPIAFQGGAWFLLFALPVALGVWIVRSRTRVDTEGLHVHRLVGSRTLPWSEVATLRLVPRGWVRAVPTEGAELELRGVRVRDLGRVGEASGGRISAPTPAEAEAAAEHARELEAARMRVAKLRERRAAEDEARTADEPAEEPADEPNAEPNAEPTTDRPGDRPGGPEPRA